MLGKVRGHILLEVEVSELLTLLKLQKLGKGAVGLNDATVVLVLELVALDVSVQSLGDLSAGQLSAWLDTKESGELIGDEGGLDETRCRTVTGLGLSAATLGLGGCLDLTDGTGVVCTQVGLELGHLRGDAGHCGDGIGEILFQRGDGVSGGDHVLSDGLSGLHGGGLHRFSFLDRSGCGLSILLGCLGSGLGLDSRARGGHCFQYTSL